MNKTWLEKLEKHLQKWYNWESVHSLAEQYSISVTAVRKRLKWYTIPKTNAQKLRNYYNTDKEGYLQKVKLWIKSMMKEFGVSESTIYRVMREVNRKKQYEEHKKFEDTRELNKWTWDRTEEKPYWLNEWEIVQVWQRPLQSIPLNPNTIWHPY